MKLIDIHTHHLKDLEERIEVKVFTTLHEIEEIETPYCIGAHPWFLEEFDFDMFKKTIKTHQKNNHFFALGEIGLDRNKGIEYTIQLDIFSKLTLLARELKIPRIVIHSVKAAEDILKIIKKNDYKGKVIFHDYNENEIITSKLLKINSYFSFGNNFLKENARASKVFNLIPKERIFFETDEKNNLLECYKKAQLLSGHDFTSTCYENYLNILKD